MLSIGLLGIPGCRALSQQRRQFGRILIQMVTDRLGEQHVVTIPAALDIKGDQKQPGALDAQEHVMCELSGSMGDVRIACAPV